MTLILTALTRNFVIQVGDRLVSKGYAPFDKQANKAIIYRPWDAIVSVGYTGLAYIKGRPTDEWIAEQLWGEPVIESMLCIFRKKHNRRDLGLSIIQLQEALARISSKIGSNEWTHPIEISLAGWYWQGCLARPTFVCLHKAARSCRVYLNRIKRHWYMDAPIIICDTGGWIRADLKNFQILESKVSCLPSSSHLNPSLITNALAETIREVSSSTRGIGRDLMSVQMPVPPEEVSVQYLPETSLLQDTQNAADAYYGPCIVGTTMIMFPSVTQSSYGVTSGNIKINVIVPKIMENKLGIKAQTRGKLF